MEELKLFIASLQRCSVEDLVETARQQANGLVQEGSPYFAEMVRELANRLEQLSK